MKKFEILELNYDKPADGQWEILKFEHSAVLAILDWRLGIVEETLKASPIEKTALIAELLFLRSIRALSPRMKTVEITPLLEPYGAYIAHLIAEVYSSEKAGALYHKKIHYLAGRFLNKIFY